MDRRWQRLAPLGATLITFFNYLYFWAANIPGCTWETCLKGNDSGTYYTHLIRLLEGSWPNDAFYFSPLYPYFLWALHGLFQYSPEGNTAIPTLIQVFMVTLTVAMTYQIGRRLFSKKVALSTMVMLAFFQPLLFYTVIFETAVILMFMLTTAFYFLLQYQQRQQRGFIILAGLCLGIAAVGRQSNLVVMVAATLWLILHKPLRRRLAIDLPVFYLVIMLVMAPAVIYNSLERGTFVAGVITDGLINYTMGNAPHSPGTYFKPKHDYDLDLVIEFITQQPGAWLLLTVRKFIFFTLPWVWVRIYLSNGLPLSWIIPWLILDILYLIYFVKTFSTKRTVLHLSLLFYTVAMVLAHVEDEFRIPIMPLVLLIASTMVIDLVRAAYRAPRLIYDRINRWRIQKPAAVLAWSLAVVTFLIWQIPTTEVSQKIDLVDSPPIFGGVVIGQRFRVNCPNFYRLETKLFSQNPNGVVTFRLMEEAGPEIFSQDISTAHMTADDLISFSFPKIAGSAGKTYIFTFDTANLHSVEESISFLGRSYPLEFNYLSQRGEFDPDIHFGQNSSDQSWLAGFRAGDAFIAQQNQTQHIQGDLVFWAYCETDRAQLVETAIHNLAGKTPLPGLIQPLILPLFIIHAMMFLTSAAMIAYRAYRAKLERLNKVDH